MQEEDSRISSGKRDEGVHAAPSPRELLALAFLSFVVMWITVIVLHRSRGLVLQYGDNDAYLASANAILHWDFHGIYIQHPPYGRDEGAEEFAFSIHHQQSVSHSTPPRTCLNPAMAGNSRIWNFAIQRIDT